jgi:hypothetical protein
MEFKKNDTSRLNEIQKSGIEGEKKVAIIVKRLMALSKDMDIVGTEEVIHKN